MKTRTLTVLAALGTAMLYFTLSLHAQIAPRALFEVDVPFAFEVGGATLPAGHYHVYHINNPNVILIRSGDCKAAAMVRVVVDPTSATASATRLVFHSYGEKKFLSEVWTAQDNERHQCVRSSAEQTIAAETRKQSAVATVYAHP